MTACRAAPTALLVVLLAASLPAQDGQGNLRYLNRDGQARSETGVTIAEETLDEVKVTRRSGGDRSFKSTTVLAVDYGPGSDAFEKGRRALADGDLMNAASMLARAAQEASPPWQAPVALLLGARAASLRSGGAAAALAAIDEFLTRFPQHRRRPEALLDKARYAAAAGDLASAAGALADAADLARQGRTTPDWGPRASLVHGQLLLQAKDLRAARERFAEAERAAGLAVTALDLRTDLQPALDEIGLQARVGTASCMLAEGDVAGARAFYARLADEAKGDPALAAAAGNGLAECDYRAGGRLKEAQYGFARVAVTGAGVPEEHARALYHLGRCAEDLGAAGLEPDGRATALRYWREVKARYPDSQWARLAEQALP